MRKHYNHTHRLVSLTVAGLGWLVCGLLVGLHILLFVSSIEIGEKIQTYEKETKKMSKENALLSEKLVTEISLQKTASVAAELSFGLPRTLTIENLRYALRKSE